MGALGSVLQKLFAPGRSRRAVHACAEERLLRAEWEQAAQPCSSTRLEVLEIYQERKAEARSTLVAHRRLCSLCRGELRGTRPGEPAMRESFENEQPGPEEHSLEHTREAA